MSFPGLLLFTGFCLSTHFGKSSADCPLPSHPPHGRHKPEGNDCRGAERHPACDGTPGTLAPDYWLLMVTCDPGYRHSDPSGADTPSVCVDGAWSVPLQACVLPDQLAKDRERCTVPETPPHSQLRLLAEECGGENLPPGSPVPHDCILYLTCSTGYQQDDGATDLLSHCNNKTWNPPVTSDVCTRMVGPSTEVIKFPSTVPSSKPSTIASFSMSCLLPEAPPSTKYCSLDTACENCDVYTQRCHLPAGSRVDRVKVVCAKGYMVETDANLAFCTPTREWYPRIPKCVKPCDPLVSEHLDFKCRYNDNTVKCSKPALPGTKVTFECRRGYSEYPDLVRDGVYSTGISCTQAGKWSGNLPLCKVACGVSNEKVQQIQPTILDGKPANVGLFPWHAGLYFRSVDDFGKTMWEQKCGGSLITDRVVLTAAHCVEGVTDFKNIRVALGKYYRSWDKVEPTEVKRNVIDIAFPNAYDGAPQYSFDIALLLLSERIKFGAHIMPVCRDYEEDTEKLYRSKVYVVGWGRTIPGVASSSENLLYSTVTIVPKETCQRAIPNSQPVFDKICAMKNNSESVVQQGDSGGGMSAVYEDGRHYIVGIVSVKINRVSMFTNVKWKVHRDWIASTIDMFVKTHGS